MRSNLWVPPTGFPMGELTLDSRALRPGMTFVALRGTHEDGRAFLKEAIAQGAVSVITEANDRDHWPAVSVPEWSVAQLSLHISALAGAYYDHPSRELKVVGVTGTNGKTSCTQWLSQVLPQCAWMGTLGLGWGQQSRRGYLTTPDAITVQKNLRWVQQQGMSTVVMEVSSHALDQGRVAGVSFVGAVLTQITSDHLDYHKTQEAYVRAKERLFCWDSLGFMVLNRDDEMGQRWMGRHRERSIPIWTYGLGPSDRKGDNSVAVSEVSLQADGVRFKGLFRGRASWFEVPVLGRFNLFNVLAVMTSALAMDVPWDELPARLATLNAPVGRMQQFGGAGLPLVVIDFAHTPDALRQVLETIRGIMVPSARLYCVFGCGGERDTMKRPVMGEIALKGADEIILTTDNPRGENPEVILKQVQEGMSGGKPYFVEPNRRRAIELAITQARTGDVVLIAGKGHETYQEIKGQKIPFNDGLIAQMTLNRRLVS